MYLFMLHKFYTCFLATLILLSLSSQLTLQAQPTGFRDDLFLGGWNQVVGMTFDQNGKLYVWERAGKVWIVENGVKNPTPLIDISQEVGGWRDFGLLGFALDPNFQTNGHIYLWYVVDRHHLMNFGKASYDPLKNEYNKATICRLTRYKAQISTNFTSVDLSSRKVLMGETVNSGPPILHESHGSGHIVFGTDGTLIITMGDGASYSSVDQGSANETYWRQALEDGIISQDENVGAYRCQMLDSYSGKIFRLDPNTGEGLPSNPYYDNTNPKSARSRVWSLGVRNPYRITKMPNTGSANPADGNPGVFYFGDVGWGKAEEINVITGPGQNFGWPKYEGLTALPGYNNAAYLPTRHDLPKIDWRGGTARGRVNGTVVNVGSAQLPGVSFVGNASTGGVWYTGNDFPEEYKNTYFHADYGKGWIRNFGFDAQHNPTVARSFVDNAGACVFLTTHPSEGGLYYVRYPGEIRKVSYTLNINQAPEAKIVADVHSGASPLTVAFKGSESTDPEGSALTYFWEFGDGYTSSEADPVHIFTATGNSQVFNVKLTVTDDKGRSSSTSTNISLNNTAPEIVSTSIDNINFYSTEAVTELPLTAVVRDGQSTVDQLTFAWQTILYHNEHNHPEPVDYLPATKTLISPVGCDGETYFFRLVLTVTDPGGLSATYTKDIEPACTANCGKVETDYLSDLDWKTLENGWGAPEKDLSNGGQGIGDGSAIKLNDIVYNKGIGAHANSIIIYDLAKKYKRFKSDIGVDDWVGSNGSVIFSVYVDNVLKYNSGLMTGLSPTQQIDLHLDGASELKLVVTDADGSISYDHADWANARLERCVPLELLPPSAPSNLQANAISHIEATLNWQDNANNESSIKIQKALSDAGPWETVILNAAPNTTTYAVQGLVPSTTYYFRVQAVNDNGPSEWSNIAMVKTNDILPCGTTLIDHLSMLQWVELSNGLGPVETDISNGGASQGDGSPIMLDGESYSNGLGVHAYSNIELDLNGKYRYFKSDIGLSDETGDLGSVVFNVYVDNMLRYTSGILTGADALRQITVYVEGAQKLRLEVTNADGSSSNDNAVWANARLERCGNSSIPSPATPLLLTANPQAATQIVLNWKDVAVNEDQYRVEIAKQATGPWSVFNANVAANSTALICNGLNPATVYFFRLQASNEGGRSPFSNIASAITFDVPNCVETLTDYISDLNYIEISNGWGPVEKDRSNNGNAANDGNPLILNGVRYAKGVGVHAYSSVEVNLDAKYRRFKSDIGVDDEVGDEGTLVFKVYVDDQLRYTSGLMTGASPTLDIDLYIEGAKKLRLEVSGENGSIADDHGDWANARLEKCNPEKGTQPETPGNLIARAISAQEVELRWIDNVTNETGFVIETAPTTEGPWTLTNETTANTTQFTVSNLLPSTVYFFRVRAKGTAGFSENSNTANDTTFSKPVIQCEGNGTITMQVWNQLSGWKISDLTSSSKYPNNPDKVSALKSFEAPVNTAEYYGARILGYICPPANGNYTFWLAGDDNAELWLSTDENPANKKRIAYHTGWTNSREWTRYATQKSASIPLEMGKKYFVEALVKEHGGGDNLAVAWAKPGQSTLSPSEIIPGSSLLPYLNVNEAPKTPGNLTATASSSTQINLLWVDNANNEEGYTIEQATNENGPWTPIVLNGEINLTNYSVTGLKANTTYYFRVRAFHSSASSAYSNIASATTNANEIPPVVCEGAGKILYQRWDGITGTSVGNLKSNVNFPHSPTVSQLMDKFEAPINVSNNYGARIVGFICPPLSGSYTFWIAGDDNAELWLSNTEKPADKKLIAFHTGWTASRQWNKFTTQKSIAVNLVAGQKYYVEALVKEGGGSDNLAVGWSKPGQSQASPSEVIPGAHLLPYVPLAAPSNLVAEALSYSEIKLTWVDNTNTETSFELEYATSETGPWKVLAKGLAPNSNTYTAIELIENTQYFFRIRTFEGTISSAYSNRAAAKTKQPNLVRCLESGSISFERWNNITGPYLSNLRNNAKYPNQPSSSGELKSFEIPVNSGDSYGVRVRGYICPPLTGKYTFWLAGDDYAELLLSSDEDPLKAVRIAYHNGWTNSRQWNKYSTQKSIQIILEAGRKYYVEALVKEAGGGDNLAVGWAKPGQSTAQPSEVIPGSALIPYTKPTVAGPQRIGIDSEELFLFPNPASEAFTVMSGDPSDKILEVSLYDQVGRKVITNEQEFGADRVVSKLRQAKAGLYLVRVTTLKKGTQILRLTLL